MGDLKARGFNCRNCGAPVTLRGLSWTQTVTCPSCDAIQDPEDPNLLVLQEAERRQRVRPLIPLGTRGTIGGRQVEVIGFQYRTIEVDGETYGWSEYLLFNPYHGFRYLSDLRNPASVPVFLDCAYADVWPSNGNSAAPVESPPDLSGAASVRGAPEHWKVLLSRHARGVNVYHADGGASWIRLDDLYLQTWNADWVQYRLKLPTGG